MSDMFNSARDFNNVGNNNISKWNVTSVVSMNNMFEDAETFNRNLRDWNVDSVDDFTHMFRDATKLQESFPNIIDTPEKNKWTIYWNTQTIDTDDLSNDNVDDINTINRSDNPNSEIKTIVEDTETNNNDAFAIFEALEDDTVANFISDTTATKENTKNIPNRKMKSALVKVIQGNNGSKTTNTQNILKEMSPAALASIHQHSDGANKDDINNIITNALVSNNKKTNQYIQIKKVFDDIKTKTFTEDVVVDVNDVSSDDFITAYSAAGTVDGATKQEKLEGLSNLSQTILQEAKNKSAPGDKKQKLSKELISKFIDLPSNVKSDVDNFRIVNGSSDLNLEGTGNLTATIDPNDKEGIYIYAKEKGDKITITDGSDTYIIEITSVNGSVKTYSVKQNRVEIGPKTRGEVVSTTNSDIILGSIIIVPTSAPAAVAPTPVVPTPNPNPAIISSPGVAATVLSAAETVFAELSLDTTEIVISNPHVIDIVGLNNDMLPEEKTVSITLENFKKAFYGNVVAGDNSSFQLTGSGADILKYYDLSDESANGVYGLLGNAKAGVLLPEPVTGYWAKDLKKPIDRWSTCTRMAIFKEVQTATI